MVSRRVNPPPAVVTIGKVHAGTARSIIRRQRNCRGRCAYTDPETPRTPRRSETPGRDIAAAYDLLPPGHPHERFAAISDPPQAARLGAAMAEAVVGAQNVVPMPKASTWAAKDFAFYVNMPGCFMRIGARRPGGDPRARTPYFTRRREHLRGAAVLQETARRASADLR